MNCFTFIEFHPVSAVFNEGKLFHNIYDASGERTLKAQGEYQGLFENGVPTDGGVQLNAYTTYPSPYITISPKEVYTKHYFAGTQRVASKPEGKAGIFNTSPLHGYEELKIRQLGDAQAVADTVDLGIITLGGPIEEPVNPDVYYFHPDHLGTSTMISDGSGYAYQFFLNLPFGETMAEQRRSGSFNNPYKFNGKELDEETGLYYYGARHYNPRISNWLSVDPIALWQPVQETEHYILGQHNGGYFNPRNMSVYGYTYQNPVLYIAPNGKQNIANGLIGGTKKALLSVAEQTFYRAARFYMNNNKSLSGFNFGEVEIDKYTVGLEFGKGFAEGVSPVGLFKGLKDFIKVAKIGYNASKDSKVGFFEDESKNVISILDIFDKKNEKHLKTFINSIVFGTFEEFLIDGLKNDFDQTFDKGTMDEIIKYLTDKSSELIFEAVKQTSSEIQNGYSTIEVE
ncbi:MAG: RHS repeat-associated core domain-containing protein [Weeksellaceae bacterium]